MATKAFGVKELKIDGSGTPTIESPSGGNLNLTAATSIFSGHISLGDSKIIKLGAAPDMSIFHDGTNGSINLANGNLTVRVHDAGTSTARGLYIEDPNSGTAQTIAKFEKDSNGGAGRCELMHGGSKVFETVSGGVTITGNLSVTGSYPGGGGGTTFVALTDTPNSFSGQAGKILKVNSSVDELEFSDVEAITISTAESTDDNNAYNIPFLTSTGAGGAQKGLQVDNGGLWFNPGTNYFGCQNIVLGTSSNAAGSMTVWSASGSKFGQINGIAFGIGNNSSSTTNVIIGQTDTGTTIGGLNVGLGYQALQGSGAASYNVAAGFQALMGNDGAYNVALGDNALSGSGSYNIGIGRQAGHQINGAQFNIFMGHQCARSVTNIGHSFVAGYNALDSITDGGGVGSNNYGHIAIGFNSQKEFEGGGGSGTPNIGIGIYSLEKVVQTGSNIAIGNFAMRYLGENMTSSSYDGGYGNVAVGYGALQGGYNGTFNTTSTFRGDYNVGVGWGALQNLTSYTSDKNTAVGVEAGRWISTGSNNTCIGNESGDSNSPSGQLTTNSNIICLGNDSVSAIYCADTSISSSDQRDKTDVVNFTHGLNWVNQLNPVTYRWDKRTWYGTGVEGASDEFLGTPDGSKKASKVNIGFLAQDVLTIEGNPNKDNMLIVNLNENETRYGLKYERLVPVLVNAIKELSAKNDALEARIAALES